jgi:branched-chain amino acid transport system substrate-binding protein
MQPVMIRRRNLLAAAAATAALPARSPAWAAEPLRIGVMTDLNGILANDAGQGSVIAAQMAIDEVNGIIAGRPIDLLVGDHQMKPDIGASLSRQWWDSGVAAIFDVPNSAIALGIAASANARNRVFCPGTASTSALTNEKCSPNTVAFGADNYALGHACGAAILAEGGTSWFFLTSDYAFGYDLEAQAQDAVKKGGGKIVGAVRVPLGATDYSSFLLQAQQSGAQVLMISSVGADTTNAIKQAHEFGLTKTMRIAAPTLSQNDAHSVGVEIAQGILAVANFQWNLNDGTRAFTQRFSPRNPRHWPPTNLQAGVYSSVRHYLKAVAKGTDPMDGRAVVAMMKQIPVQDDALGHAIVRADGRVMQTIYLLRVKKPGEPTSEWDQFSLVRSIPPEQAFRPPSASACDLLKA